VACFAGFEMAGPAPDEIATAKFEVVPMTALGDRPAILQQPAGPSPLGSVLSASDPDVQLRCPPQAPVRPRYPGYGGPPPALGAFLACDGDQTEVADRGTVGTGVPLEQRPPLARPGSGPGMGKPQDAATNHSKIEYLTGHGTAMTMAQLAAPVEGK